MGERELTYGEAVREAIAEEMRRDPRVFLIGEDVAEAGHPFKTLVGLVNEFGTKRVIDTPISEPGYAGIGVGAAMTGMRPIVDVMFGDFITLTMDQMVNQAAKAHYMSGGKIKVPIVFRTTLGATRRSAAQHSQSLHAWVSHIPGLKVALPSGPYEAKGLIRPFRTDGGTRRYSGRDLAMVDRITTLLAGGLNLAGVEQVLALEAQARTLRAEIDDLQEQLGDRTPPDTRRKK